MDRHVSCQCPEWQDCPWMLMSDWGWILTTRLPHDLQLDQSQWSCFWGAQRSFSPTTSLCGQDCLWTMTMYGGIWVTGPLQDLYQTEVSRPAFGGIDGCLLLGPSVGRTTFCCSCQGLEPGYGVSLRSVVRPRSVGLPQGAWRCASPNMILGW